MAITIKKKPVGLPVGSLGAAHSLLSAIGTIDILAVGFNPRSKHNDLPQKSQRDGRYYALEFKKWMGKSSIGY
jgi:hypothetical protein